MQIDWEEVLFKKISLIKKHFYLNSIRKSYMCV